MRMSMLRLCCLCLIHACLIGRCGAALVFEDSAFQSAGEDSVSPRTAIAPSRGAGQAAHRSIDLRRIPNITGEPATVEDFAADEQPAPVDVSPSASTCFLDGATWDSMHTPLGMHKEPWQPMAFEVEMYVHMNGSELSEPEFVQKRACGLSHSGNCSKRMFLMKQDHADDSAGWVFEKELKAQEGEPHMWELSSPITLTNEEMEMAVLQTHKLEDYFGKTIPRFRNKGNMQQGLDNPPGLHLHVHGKCLLQDERRLVALILTMDTLHTTLLNYTGSTMHANPRFRKFSKTYKEKNPKLHEHLTGYVTQTGWQDSRGVDNLTAVFNQFEPDLEDGPEPHNGYRRVITNVCHLLDIKCAHDWPEKNEVPKFGGVEFRGFDSMIGEKLRLLAMFLQRLVQAYCVKSLDELLKVVTAKTSEDLMTSLLDLLGIREVFVESKFESQS